ncbi:MAG: bifunctional diguanylate cyclase/phosphodiesterase [Eubacterium sp.]
MKKHFKIMIPVMALCLVILCTSAMYMIVQIQSYGKLINYVGIVRGGTQRLVKLEMNEVVSDEIVSYLDGILRELMTGEGPIGLVSINDANYNHDLENLNQMWGDLKEDIKAVRGGEPPTELLEHSESYFKLANQTVFDAERYSNQQTCRLSILVFAMIIAMAMSWAFILFIYIRRLLRMENKNKDLRDKVFTDALTGAPNLEKFQLDSRARLAENTHVQWAVFYSDINNFKYYNDVFGLKYGDEILKKYANLIKEDMTERDVFCHIGTDNFLVLRQYSDKKELIHRQEKVDEQIAQYVLRTKGQHLFTLSCGICCTEDLLEKHQIENLIERANFARKTVKDDPLNHYAFYDESIRDKMLSEKSIENRMYTALKNKEFTVYMQPKVSLETNQIVCAEALVRWVNPNGQIVPPDKFIPIFEKNLFITALDKYMLEEVCQWIRKRIDEKQCVVSVSVNVSRMQLFDPEFVKNYTEIKDKYRIPSGMIEVEFTESMIFENIEVFLQIIIALKKAGFLCSLDDFGKGYSSLNLLRKLPVDVLKLDKVFFDKDDAFEKARTIIIGVVAMVKQLNIKVVAEGVEEKEQVAFLRSIGCDLVQGYVFYRPMPLKEFEYILAGQMA